MTFATSKTIKSFVLASCATSALILSGAASAQAAEQHEFEIAPQDLGDALAEFSVQGDAEVYWLNEDVAGKKTDGVSGSYTNRQAIEKLLDDAGVEYRIDDNGTLLVGEAYIQRASLGEGSSEARSFRMASLAQDEDVREIEQRDDDEDEDDEQGEDVIVVTGTNIRGAAPVGAPLFQFDREAIDLTGATNVQEFFETFPQNFGGGVSDSTNTIGDAVGGTSSLDRGAGLNLRGLGNGANLVLINGTRVAANGRDGFVDVSLIPITAVERIDVLTDGASAIYGTDAVSGVINIILRDDFDGFETVASFGTVTDGGLRDYRLTQSFGTSWNSGNAFLSYDYSDRGGLLAEEREFTESVPGPRNLIAAQERHSVLGSIKQELSPRLTASLIGLYTNRSSADTIQVGDGFGLDDRTSESDQYNLSGGLNAQLSEEWSADLSASYSYLEQFYTSDFSIRDQQSRTTDSQELITIDAKTSGALFDLPGGSVRVALGGQYRSEDFSIDSTTVRDGTPRVSEIVGSRDIFALFGEVFIPLIGESNARGGVNRLELALAGRYEDYSDFGSSFDPRVGVNYEPIDGLTLRGSWSTSFRAPLLVEVSNLANRNIAITRFISSENTPDMAGDIPAIILLGSIDDLGPENSTSWTVGADIEPKSVPNLALSVTYFNIEYDDRIAVPAPFQQLLTALVTPGLDGIVTRNPSLAEVETIFDFPLFFNTTPPVLAGDIEAIIDGTTQNLSATSVQGLDYSLSYAFEGDFGRISLSSVGSYYIEFANQLTATAPVFDVADTVYNPADFVMRNTAVWQKGGFRGLLAFNYTDSYTNNVVTPVEQVDSWETFDFQLAYNTGEKTQTRWLRNTEFLLNISNLLDEDPPFVRARSDEFLFDATNANPRGRFVSFQIRKRW